MKCRLGKALRWKVTACVASDEFLYPGSPVHSAPARPSNFPVLIFFASPPTFYTVEFWRVDYCCGVPLWHNSSKHSCRPSNIFKSFTKPRRVYLRARSGFRWRHTVRTLVFWWTNNKYLPDRDEKLSTGPKYNAQNSISRSAPGLKIKVLLHQPNHYIKKDGIFFSDKIFTCKIKFYLLSLMFFLWKKLFNFCFPCEPGGSYPLHHIN